MPTFHSPLELENTCPYCKQSVPARWDICQNCGQRIVSHTALRVGGVVYLIFGVGLCGVMVYLGIYIGNIMAHSKDPGVKWHFNGTPMMAAGIYVLFALIFFFGFTMVVTGLWQIIKGTRNTKLVKVAVAWYGVFIVLALVAQLGRLLGIGR